VGPTFFVLKLPKLPLTQALLGPRKAVVVQFSVFSPHGFLV
jgi:hypothetical protein